MEIRIKLMLILLIISIFPMIFIGFLSFNNAKSTLEYVGENRVTGISGLETITHFKITNIEQFIKELEEEIETSQNYYNVKINLPIVSRFINDRTNQEYIAAKKTLDGQLKPFKNIEGIIDILLLDTQGNLVYTTDFAHKEDELGKGFSLKNAGENIVQKSKEEIFFSQIFSSPYSKSGFEILVAGPIYDFDKKLTGSIIFGVNMDPVYEILQDRNGLGETGETMIARKMKSHPGIMVRGHSVNKPGDHLVYLNPLRFDSNAALNRTVFFGEEEALPMQQAVQGKEGSGTTINYMGKEVLSVWRYIPLLDIGIITEIESEELLSPVFLLRNQIFTFGLIIFFFVFVLVFFVSSKMTRPIRKLINVAEEMEKGNLKVRVDIKEKNEFKKLGDTLNKSIDALSKLDKERKEIDSAKTEFLSITSHELRSPMTPMKAQLQMILGEYFGKLNAKQKESLEIVLRNTNNLDRIIVDFLEVSRIEAARLKFKFVKTDLTKFIHRIVEEMKGFMPEKKIKIDVKVGKLPIIEADPDRILQILRNLINNAKKFSPDNSTLTLTADLKDNMIEFSVKDQGIGVDLKNQRKIFEPFFQAEQTIYREHKGTGLGLAIVRGIVEAQEGRVWVESEKDKGTTFYFTIPLKPVKEIKPIKLLFSSEGKIQKQIKEMLINFLGPMGEQEFEHISISALNHKNVKSYLDNLLKKGIIGNKDYELMLSQIKDIFEESKGEKIAQKKMVEPNNVEKQENKIENIKEKFNILKSFTERFKKNDGDKEEILRKIKEMGLNKDETKKD